jgi:hypothetical protein
MNTPERMLEVFGYIKKQETLSTIDGHILPQTWVLESLKPFPGYHGSNEPDESDPRSIFLMLTQALSFEEVARMSKIVKKQYNQNFNASEGCIYFQPYTYHCIRLKYLSSFEYIHRLQELFAQAGAKYLKTRAMSREGLIQINKNFLVREMEPGIYQDMNNQVKTYIELPEKLQWEDFKKYTFNIKNNLVDNNFDAAQGVFFRKKEIVDVVRIYDFDRSIEKMRLLKDMYEEEIRKSYK